MCIQCQQQELHPGASAVYNQELSEIISLGRREGDVRYDPVQHDHHHILIPLPITFHIYLQRPLDETAA